MKFRIFILECGVANEYVVTGNHLIDAIQNNGINAHAIIKTELIGSAYPAIEK